VQIGQSPEIITIQVGKRDKLIALTESIRPENLPDGCAPEAGAPYGRLILRTRIG